MDWPTPTAPPLDSTQQLLCRGSKCSVARVAEFDFVKDDLDSGLVAALHRLVERGDLAGNGLFSSQKFVVLFPDLRLRPRLCGHLAGSGPRRKILIDRRHRFFKAFQRRRRRGLFALSLEKIS